MEEKQERFEKLAKEYLSAKGLAELRVYARYVGVDKGTTLKKEELIENIVQACLVEKESPTNKRGQPPKGDYLPPKFLQDMEDIQRKVFGDENEEINKSQSGTVLNVSIQMDKLNPAQKKLLNDILNTL